MPGPAVVDLTAGPVTVHSRSGAAPPAAGVGVRPVSLDPDPAAPPFEPRHAALRAEVRRWVDERVRPFADEWERAREFPRSLYPEAGQAGLLGWKYGPEVGGRGPDLLADVVVTEEMARCGSGGVAAGLGATKDLAPYYVARFGTDAQRDQWLRPAVSGAAVAALSVTEPGVGSDVAGIRCRAERDGAGWVLSGEKTFCTNGSRADWLLVAARIGDEPGPRAISLFLVPASAPGFSASRIATLGWRTSQTGLLRLDGVAVPGDALLGEPGSGFVMIMKSFQWERLSLAVAAVSAAAYDLGLMRRHGRPVPGWQRLVAELAAARALTYEALTDFLAGREPLAAVSAAKWLACDLAVETGLARVAWASGLADASRRAVEVERAETALRDARLGPIGGGAREIMAELVARSLPGMGRSPGEASRSSRGTVSRG